MCKQLPVEMLYFTWKVDHKNGSVDILFFTLSCLDLDFAGNLILYNSYYHLICIYFRLICFHDLDNIYFIAIFIHENYILAHLAPTAWMQTTGFQ